MPLDIATLIGVVILSCIWWYLTAIRKGSRPGASDTEFLYMDGKLQAFEFSDTFAASSISVATVFMGISAFSVVYRGLAWWLLVGFMLGMWVFFLICKRLSQKFQNGRTISQVLGMAYGSESLKKTVSLVSIAYLVGFIGVELFAIFLLLRILSPNLPIPVHILITIASALLFVGYSYAGGYKGIQKNDSIQLYYILVATGILIIASVLFATRAKMPAVSVATQLVPLSKSLTQNLIIGGACLALMIPWLSSTADTWHRGVAAKMDVARIKEGLIGKHAKVLFILTLTWGSAVLVGVLFPTNQASETAFSNFLQASWQAFSHLPSVFKGLIGGLVCAGLLAAIMSSVDTMLMTLGFVVCSDLIPSYANSSSAKRVATAKFFVLVGGMSAVMIPILAIVLHLNIYHVISTIGSSVVVLFPAILLLSLAGERNLQSPFYRTNAILSVIIPIIILVSIITISMNLQDDSLRSTCLSGAPLMCVMAAFLVLAPAFIRLLVIKSKEK